MGRFGREIALRTGNLDYFFETLKTELESETLGFEIFSSGSCELREAVGTSLVSATEVLETGRIPGQDCLPPQVASF